MTLVQTVDEATRQFFRRSSGSNRKTTPAAAWGSLEEDDDRRRRSWIQEGQARRRHRFGVAQQQQVRFTCWWRREPGEEGEEGEISTDFHNEQRLRRWPNSSSAARGPKSSATNWRISNKWANISDGGSTNFTPMTSLGLVYSRSFAASQTVLWKASNRNWSGWIFGHWSLEDDPQGSNGEKLPGLLVSSAPRKRVTLNQLKEIRTIRWEPYRRTNKSVTQCQKCLRFGHGTRNCCMITPVFQRWGSTREQRLRSWNEVW